MKPAILALVCAYSVQAQITATLDRLPGGSTEIRLRNDAPLNLVAFAVSVNYATRLDTNGGPLIVYVDPATDGFPSISTVKPVASGPLQPNQEFTWEPGLGVAVSPLSGTPTFDQPIAAGIYSDGTTAGDAALLTRLLLRRSSMLQAVETAMETLSQAGTRNLQRDQVLVEFQKMANSVRRWYLLPEQQAGLGLYQSIIGTLTNPPRPFSTTAFAARQTALLTPLRTTLLGSKPSLADTGLIGR